MTTIYAPIRATPNTTFPDTLNEQSVFAPYGADWTKLA